MKSKASSNLALEPLASGWWFIFSGYKLLVQAEDDNVNIPFVESSSILKIKAARRHYLGILDGSACYEGECSSDVEPPEGMSFEGLRPLFGRLDSRFYQFAGRAFQIMDWDRTHQFCSRCGSPARDKEDETAKICDSCGFISFPVASPAIIVAVTRGDEILLARAARFPKDMYSVLAGFVEPGESLEECVRREIKEEVGVEVNNIRYFGSQPWPFPNSLMIGFTAEYRGGEIRADGREIIDAGWFKAGNFPRIPDKISIARRLIDWFTAESLKSKKV